MGRRTKQLVLLVVAGVLGLGIVAQDALAGGPCPECSAVYAGSWDGTYKLKNVGESTFTTFQTSLKWKATLTWDKGKGENVWHLLSASGSFSISGSPPDSQPNCTTQLEPGPDTIVRGESFWGTTADGISPSPQNGFGKYWTVLVQPPAQWGQSGGVFNPLKAAGAAAGTGCASQSATFVGQGGPWAHDLGGGDCLWDSTHYINWVAFPVGSDFTVPETCSGSGGDANGNSWSASLTASLTFRSPGNGPGGGPIHAGTQPPGFGPSLSDIKDLAREDFKAGLKDALGPCIQLGAGLSVMATGAVWLSASATVPGGIPSGAAIIGAGEVMSTVGGQQCGAKLGRLLDDYKVFDDPPDPNYLQLASVATTGHFAKVSAACNKVSGKARAFCRQLAPLAASLVRAANRTKAVDDALVTTVNRASGAKRAHDQAALTRQLSHAKSLEGQLQAALRGEASIGRQIRRLLPFGHLTRSQAAKAISYLERKGVTAAHLRRIDPAGRTPTALDPIARLVNP